MKDHEQSGQSTITRLLKDLEKLFGALIFGWAGPPKRKARYVKRAAKLPTKEGTNGLLQDVP